jgi:hypothetical protein
MLVMESITRYQVNVCGGDFQHVRDCFRAWKNEPLVYSKDRRMFEGREEVRMLSAKQFDDAERARNALENACSPQHRYALAVQVDDGERDMWIVMAAYRE